MYFENYQPENIKPSVVKQEGEYQVKIDNVECGQTNDGVRWTRIICVVLAEGAPRVSLFLTEGKNFNATATAFYDTFNIPRGDTNPASWRGKTGRIKIFLGKKNGYTEMYPRYILDENGFVVRSGQPQQYNAMPSQAEQDDSYPF